MKQVILIRKDLKMRRGKEIAQGSHASMAFIAEQLRAALGVDAGAAELPVLLNPTERAWLLAGAAKVCLRVESEAALLDYHRRAVDAGLVSHLIRDSGRTEFGGVPTLTACAIGPDDASLIDTITSELVPY
ncbi:MAG: aminoacyl-tRNA hydrolase [Proteobacteria bacterium]|nr:MAG: aminoacyl-tRNA hydrolase [Pseudomonadota bacterium]